MHCPGPFSTVHAATMELVPKLQSLAQLFAVYLPPAAAVQSLGQLQQAAKRLQKGSVAPCAQRPMCSHCSHKAGAKDVEPCAAVCTFLTAASLNSGQLLPAMQLRLPAAVLAASRLPVVSSPGSMASCSCPQPGMRKVADLCSSPLQPEPGEMHLFGSTEQGTK